MDVVYRTPATLVDQPEQDGLSNLHIRAPEPFFVSTRLGGSAWSGGENRSSATLVWWDGSLDPASLALGHRILIQINAI
jgi:hypothetical protein